MGGNLNALKDCLGHINAFQGCWVNLGPEEMDREDVPLVRLFISVTHLELLAGEFAVYEKHFLFSGDLFGQLGSKNGFSCVRARKEDGVLPLYDETVAILFRHMGIL